MKILKKTIVGFFRDNSRRGAGLDRPMLWGYFFIDANRKKLKALVPELETSGLRFVEIFKGDDVLWLHVEEELEHSPASLHKRCSDLDELANQHGLLNFDGFDVGHIDGSVLCP